MTLLPCLLAELSVMPKLAPGVLATSTRRGPVALRTASVNRKEKVNMAFINKIGLPIIHMGRSTLGVEAIGLCSISPSLGSDVACLFAKRSSKLCAQSEIVHTGSCAHKNKECVHTLTSCVCVLTSLPGDDETEYTRGLRDGTT